MVLLERKQLTSGTTWHAAGLIAQLRATANMTKLAKYSQELYGNLEAETGVATGFKRCGSITVALTEERREEIYRQAAMARAFGVDVEEISPNEVQEQIRTPQHRRCDRRRLSATRTGRATLPISRWRWPRARASAGRKSSSARGHRRHPRGPPRHRR